MRNLCLLSLLVLTACAPLVETPAPQGVIMPMATPALAPSVTPSAIPTPTVDWQSASNAASTQAASYLVTIDAANLALAQIEADKERMQYEQVMLTATFDLATLDANQKTSVAAPLVIPTTETAAYWRDRQIETQQALDQAQMTAVKEEPTQIVARARAESEAQTAGLWEWVNLFLAAAAAMFFLALAYAVIKLAGRPYKPAPVPAPKAAPVVSIPRLDDERPTITIRHEGPDGVHGRVLNFPCSPEDLLIFAHEFPFYGTGVNQFDGTSRPSPLRASNKRQAIEEMREWLVDSELAVKDRRGHVVLNNDGEEVFRILREEGLPHQWSCTPDHGDLPEESFHGHEIMRMKSVGEGLGEGMDAAALDGNDDTPIVPEDKPALDRNVDRGPIGLNAKGYIA